RIMACLCELVPGTNGKAIVAAIDAVAHCCAQFACNGPFMLDCQIRNAAPGIEPIGGRECGRRANVEASAAAAANILLRRIGRQFQRGENCAEKEPGAELARYQIGVLALPPQSCGGSEGLFHERCRVDEYLYVAARVRKQPARQALEPRLDNVVIV